MMTVVMWIVEEAVRMPPRFQQRIGLRKKGPHWGAGHHSV